MSRIYCFRRFKTIVRIGMHAHRPYKRPIEVWKFYEHAEVQICRLFTRKKIAEKYSNKVHAYLDDWVVISKAFDELLLLLDILFDILKNAGLTINSEKSFFARQLVDFLEFLLDKDGLKPNPKRMEPILGYPRPRNRMELRQLNGSVNWYHRHLRNIAIN